MAGFTSIGGGGSPERQTYARSLDQTYAINPNSRLVKRGDADVFEDFRDGNLGAFRPQHWAFATPNMPVGLSRFLPFGSTHSMVLSGSDVTDYNANSRGNGCATYAGGSRKRNDTGIVTVSFIYGLAQGGSPATQTAYNFGWGQFEIGIDVMKGDGSARSFFKARFTDTGAGRGTLLQLRQNSTATATDTGTTTWVDVPGTAGMFPGGNEGKLVPGYLALTVDENTMQYVQVQVMDKVVPFNISGGQTVGQAKDKILQNGATDDYSFGRNFDAAYSRSSRNPTIRDARMHIGQALMTVNDVVR